MYSSSPRCPSPWPGFWPIAGTQDVFVEWIIERVIERDLSSSGIGVQLSKSDILSQALALFEPRFLHPKNGCNTIPG